GEGVGGFGMGGGRAEVWGADTGRFEPVSVYETTAQTIRMPLRLEPSGSVFVVFRSGSTLEKDRIVSVSRNGEPLITTSLSRSNEGGGEVRGSSVSMQTASMQARSEVDGTNTFTMAVWVKPEANIALPEEANFGKGAFFADRNDALYPPAGHDVYHSPDHAGAGLSIGRNGICVFEHTADYFAPVLVFAATLTNWSHVAVVYRDAKPSLFLNGKFVHEGLQSTFTVHSGVGVQHRRKPAQFQGSLGEFFNVHRALDQTEAARLMEEMPIPMPVSPQPTIEFRRSQSRQLQAEIWEPGTYLAENSRGKIYRFQTEALPTLDIEGPWSLSFPPHWGAPERVSLDHLISWSDHPEEGIKYFSGIGTYTKSFDLPDHWCAPNQRVYLELGRVSVMAQVRLNGEELGVLWKPPFRVEVTKVLK